MNYKKIYEDLISSRKLNSFISAGEKHHIIPKCLGGTNKKENLIGLSFREHFIAHRLLSKIYNSSYKLQTAIYLMSKHNKYTNGKKYENLRVRYISLVKGQNYETIYGKEKSIEIKKIRKKHIHKLQAKGIMTSKGKLNPMHRETSGKDDAFYSKKSKLAYKTRRINGTDKHSEEAKAKIRASCKNLNKKQIFIYDLEMNLLQTCDSLNEASRYIGSRASALSTAITLRKGIMVKKKIRVSYARLF